MNKCSSVQNQVSYLGHIVSAVGVATDSAKIQAIADWPKPSNVKELRSFLGLIGYYRKFIRHFGVICHPLHGLLKKGVVYVWTDDHSTTFQTLKEALASAPVLALPDFSFQFTIETNASSFGISVVLMQKRASIILLE